MPIRVAAYIEGGVATGDVAGVGHLREAIEERGELRLTNVWWRPLEPADGRALPLAEARPTDDLAIPVDDLLVAVADDEARPPAHASWHAIRLEVGPYEVVGEMPTLPGFDPDRALARPTGEFVMLRAVRIGMIGTGEADLLPIGEHALINRYDVERVAADLMLGFFFPGASVDPTAPLPAAGPPPATIA